MEQDLVQLRMGDRTIATGRLYRTSANEIAAVFLDTAVRKDDLERVNFLSGDSARHAVQAEGTSGEFIAFFRLEPTEDHLALPGDPPSTPPAAIG